MIERQMLLSFDPKISERFRSDIINAHGDLADEINRKSDKPLAVAALAGGATTAAIAAKVNELLEALQQ